MTAPTLTGSEKQITWAEKIRAEVLAEVPAFQAKVEAMKAQSKGTPEQIAAMSALLEQGTERLAGQSEARFWIDQAKGCSAEFLIKQFAKQIQAGR